MSVGKNKIANVLTEMIEENVQSQIHAINEDLRLKEEQILKQYRDQVEEACAVYKQQELRDLKQEITQNATKSRWDLKKSLFIRRNELVDSLFDEVLEQLKTFSHTEAYHQYLTQAIQLCEKYIPHYQSTLYVRDEDSVWMKENFGKHTIVIDEDNHLGGFVCMDQTRGVELDYRLVTKLEMQREWFIKHSQLIVA